MTIKIRAYLNSFKILKGNEGIWLIKFLHFLMSNQARIQIFFKENEGEGGGLDPPRSMCISLILNCFCTLLLFGLIVDAANKCCWKRCKLKRKKFNVFCRRSVYEELMLGLTSELAFLVVESLEHARSCEAKVGMIRPWMGDRFTLQYIMYITLFWICCYRAP